MRYVVDEEYISTLLASIDVLDAATQEWGTCGVNDEPTLSDDEAGVWLEAASY